MKYSIKSTDLRTAAVFCLLFLASGHVTAQVIYDSIPDPLPGNVPSLGYQATQTSEFGDLIAFAGVNRTLTTVTLVMSDWARKSDFSSPGTGFNHPLTLNLYNVDNSGPNPAPGTVIASKTQTFFIPFRPEDDVTCPAGKFRASDGICYSGLAFKVTFDFTGTVVPNQIIYGLAYNTTNWGYHPIGVSGPWESLNFGLAQVPPTVGTNPFPDTAYWNTATPGNYADGGAGGVGIFRRDTNWTPYSGAILFATTPDVFQISYVANVLAGDSFVNLTNTGVQGGSDPAGDICANVYVLAADQQLIACCSCQLTPNHLKTLSAQKDLLAKTLTPGSPANVTVALLASTSCDASAVTAANLVGGLRAWRTTLHASPSGGFGVTENPFSFATLSASELAKLTSYCGFIQSDGSGFGICNECREGAQGATRQ
jgi:hypothetical protein